MPMTDASEFLMIFQVWSLEPSSTKTILLLGLIFWELMRDASLLFRRLVVSLRQGSSL